MKIAVFATAVATALVALPASSQAADPIEVHAIVAMTGSSGFIGSEASKALVVVEDTVNKTGGVRGRPIKFVVQDDQSDARVAVQLANVLLERNVPVILGPNPVAACSAVAPLVKDRAVMICTSSAYHPTPNTYVYVAGVSSVDQVLLEVRYLRQRGLTKIATINSADAIGADVENAMAAALALPENKGVSVVDSERFAVTDLTVDAQMSRIKAAGAQAILCDNNGTPLGLVLHAYADLGMQVPFATANGALTVTGMKQFTSLVPREFLVSGSLNDGADAVPPGPVKNAIRTYETAMRSAGLDPDHAHAVDWDPSMMIVGALRQYGANATAAQINAFIHNLHGWSGVSGVYDFRGGNPSGLDPSSLVMVRWSSERSTWVPVSKPGGVPLN